MASVRKKAFRARRAQAEGQLAPDLSRMLEALEAEAPRAELLFEQALEVRLVAAAHAAVKARGAGAVARAVTEAGEGPSVDSVCQGITNFLTEVLNARGKQNVRAAFSATWMVRRAW